MKLDYPRTWRRRQTHQPIGTRMERLEDRTMLDAAMLDMSFGSGGVVTTDFDGRFDTARAVVVQPDGRILVAGASEVAGPLSNRFALARYLADGTLDPSFGSAGRVTTDLGAVFDGARDIAVQSDGRIIVVGQADLVTPQAGQRGDFAIASYNSDGTPDTSFGVGGIVLSPDFRPGPAGSAEGASAVVIDIQGRIVVAGSHLGLTGEVALARYESDGTLDTSFGPAGTGFITY